MFKSVSTIAFITTISALGCIYYQPK